MTRVLLDTNVVLDALLFADPKLARLGSTSFDLIAHEDTLAELRRVLAYPKLKLPADTQSRVLDDYRAMTRVVSFSPDELQSPLRFPRCRDPDDQVFLVLALQAKATLVTRDKALLGLRRRAAKFVVCIEDVAWLHSRLPA
jgi:uncharacterized protein